MTRDFIFLCLLRSEPFHGSCPTPAHITLQTYPSGLHKTAFLGEQTPYLFANPRAPLTAPCAPLWLCKFKESGSDEQEYNASYFLFFSFSFFIYLIYTSHETTNWIWKITLGQGEGSRLWQPEVSPAGVGVPAGMMALQPSTGLFTQESACSPDFFLFRCILKSLWWGMENFCACRFNQFVFFVLKSVFGVRILQSRGSQTLRYNKAIWRACWNSFPCPIPSNSGSADLGGAHRRASLTSSPTEPAWHTVSWRDTLREPRL